MSRCCLTDVSNIQTTGNSITTARIVRSTISMPDPLGRKRPPRPRTSSGSSRSTMSSICAGTDMSVRLHAAQVADVDLREQDHDDHHQDPVGGGEAGVEVLEPDLIDLERERLRRAARAAAGEDVD